ncbi:hypothetical protein I6G96_26865 [Delftia acidovorans]|uniref:hypothetical protein n=1 Tax=Delftia acidovorans TaxID=80866 RepID=UPI0018D9E631|nr:hypothetical protein [Delftia acidovorans]QPR34499.1 hypothetical protein I6G96_26865 [Delftia acidovorans]
MNHILIPREPSTALLRPFIGCPPQELHETWAAMVRIAEVQHARDGSQCLQQIAEPATLAGTTIEQYARMFGAACEALGQVSDCLSINSEIDPGAEPIIAAIEQMRAGSTHPVLDDRWKARMLDGHGPERDEMGLGDHPELPWLDEGIIPRSFFAALGLELAHTTAEDQLDADALEAMSEAVNWTDWQPTPPQGDGWKLVSIFDTENGPVAWWLRELPEAEDAPTTSRNLKAENERLQKAINELAGMFHDQIVAQQAAYIEWQHGAGAEAAMAWIENGLCDPGHIPDEDAPYGNEAQAWFDANKHEPFPACTCGRPSNILWIGKGFCCNAHYDEAFKAYQATKAAESACVHMPPDKES